MKKFLKILILLILVSSSIRAQNYSNVLITMGSIGFGTSTNDGTTTKVLSINYADVYINDNSVGRYPSSDFKDFINLNGNSIKVEFYIYYDVKTIINRTGQWTDEQGTPVYFSETSTLDANGTATSSIPLSGF